MVSAQPKEIEIGLDWIGLAFRPCVFLLFIMSLMGLVMTGDWVLSDWLEVSCVGPQNIDRTFFQKFD